MWGRTPQTFSPIIYSYIKNLQAFNNQNIDFKHKNLSMLIFIPLSLYEEKKARLLTHF